MPQNLSKILSIFVLVLLITLSFSNKSLCAEYSATSNDTTVGNSLWNAAILRLKVSINASTATFTVTKTDDTAFITDGNLYLKDGDYDTDALVLEQQAVYKDITTDIVLKCCPKNR